MKKRDPLAHIPKPSGPTPAFVSAFLRMVAIVSPLTWIAVSLVRAIHSGYSSRYLTDPGHKRIRVYDTLVVIFSIVLLAAVFAYTFDFSFEAFYAAVKEGGDVSFIFMQFNNLPSFVILYVISGFLYFYDTRREKIIGDVNRHFKVW